MTSGIDPARFAGLLDHVQTHLGGVTHGQPPDIFGYNRGFAVGFHQHPEFDMLSVATTGVRFQRVTATLPQEFVCSALPSQDEATACRRSS